MKKANFAPIYCGMYPELAEIARSHGYALAIHGSLARDFDLIAIPWVENPSKSDVVVRSFEERFALRQTGEADVTYHGRKRYTMVISFGECFLDLQFMPTIGAQT